MQVLTPGNIIIISGCMGVKKFRNSDSSRLDSRVHLFNIVTYLINVVSKHAVQVLTEFYIFKLNMLTKVSINKVQELL